MNPSSGVQDVMPWGISPLSGLALCFGIVQGYGGAYESLEVILIYFLVLMEVYGAPDLSL